MLSVITSSESVWLLLLPPDVLSNVPEPNCTVLDYPCKC